MRVVAGLSTPPHQWRHVVAEAMPERRSCCRRCGERCGGFLSGPTRKPGTGQREVCGVRRSPPAAYAWGPLLHGVQDPQYLVSTCVHLRHTVTLTRWADIRTIPGQNPESRRKLTVCRIQFDPSIAHHETPGLPGVFLLPEPVCELVRCIGRGRVRRQAGISYSASAGANCIGSGITRSPPA